MCDRIAIINKGRLIALDTTENMLNKIQSKIVKFKINKKVSNLGDISNLIKIVSNNSKELIISYEKNKVNIQNIIDSLKAQNIDILDVQSTDPDLEDVFIKLIKD